MRTVSRAGYPAWLCYCYPPVAPRGLPTSLALITPSLFVFYLSLGWCFCILIEVSFDFNLFADFDRHTHEQLLCITFVEHTHVFQFSKKFLSICTILLNIITRYYPITSIVFVSCYANAVATPFSNGMAKNLSKCFIKNSFIKCVFRHPRLVHGEEWQETVDWNLPLLHSIRFSAFGRHPKYIRDWHAHSLTRWSIYVRQSECVLVCVCVCKDFILQRIEVVGRSFCIATGKLLLAEEGDANWEYGKRGRILICKLN